MSSLNDLIYSTYHCYAIISSVWSIVPPDPMRPLYIGQEDANDIVLHTFNIINLLIVAYL